MVRKEPKVAWCPPSKKHDQPYMTVRAREQILNEHDAIQHKIGTAILEKTKDKTGRKFYAPEP
jgi:hypothetical protein